MSTLPAGEIDDDVDDVAILYTLSAE